VTWASDWVASIRAMWADGAARKASGEASRRWVLERHSWYAAARTAAAGLTQRPPHQPRDQ
jgi:hypothetical protein